MFEFEAGQKVRIIVSGLIFTVKKSRTNKRGNNEYYYEAEDYWYPEDNLDAIIMNDEGKFIVWDKRVSIEELIKRLKEIK